MIELFMIEWSERSNSKQGLSLPFIVIVAKAPPFDQTKTQKTVHEGEKDVALIPDALSKLAYLSAGWCAQTVISFEAGST